MNKIHFSIFVDVLNCLYLHTQLMIHSNCFLKWNSFDISNNKIICCYTILKALGIIIDQWIGKFVLIQHYQFLYIYFHYIRDMHRSTVPASPELAVNVLKIRFAELWEWPDPLMAMDTKMERPYIHMEYTHFRKTRQECSFFSRDDALIKGMFSNL